MKEPLSIGLFSIYFDVKFFVLDIHLYILKRITGFWDFVLKFNWVEVPNKLFFTSFPYENISSTNLK